MYTGKSPIPKVIVKSPQDSLVTYIPCQTEYLQTKLCENDGDQE